MLGGILFHPSGQCFGSASFWCGSGSGYNLTLWQGMWGHRFCYQSRNLHFYAKMRENWIFGKIISDPSLYIYYRASTPAGMRVLSALYALVSHLKLAPGFRACFLIIPKIYWNIKQKIGSGSGCSKMAGSGSLIYYVQHLMFPHEWTQKIMIIIIYHDKLCYIYFFIIPIFRNDNLTSHIKKHHEVAKQESEVSKHHHSLRSEVSIHHHSLRSEVSICIS